MAKMVNSWVAFDHFLNKCQVNRQRLRERREAETKSAGGSPLVPLLREADHNWEDGKDDDDGEVDDDDDDGEDDDDDGEDGKDDEQVGDSWSR